MAKKKETEASDRNTHTEYAPRLRTFATVEGDLVIGTSTEYTPPEGAIEVPEQLAGTHPSELRFDGKGVRHAGEFSSFYIAQDGTRHVEPSEGRVEYKGKFDDDLVRDGEVWRQASAADRAERARRDLSPRVDAMADAQLGKSGLGSLTAIAGLLLTIDEARALKAAGETKPKTAEYPLLERLRAARGLETILAAADAVLGDGLDTRRKLAQILDTRDDLLGRMAKGRNEEAVRKVARGE